MQVLRWVSISVELKEWYVSPWHIHYKLLFACTIGLQPILVFHHSYLIIFQFNHSTHRLINKLLITNAPRYHTTHTMSTTTQLPLAAAVFERKPNPNIHFSTSSHTCRTKATDTSTTCKRRRSPCQTNNLQPPSKIRKLPQGTMNKLNGLTTILTKNVAKGVSKVFNVQSSVKGSIAMHTGGVM